MTQLASVLRAEIVRVARKEARAEIESLKKASTQHRSAIAQLRREVAELQKQLRQAGRETARQTARQLASASRPAAPDAPGAPDATPRRFSASRLAAHRAKLGISAAAYGQLVGIGGQTIFNWEQGKSRPNAQQLQQLAAVRALSKRETLE
ncbi:DNA-binding transcriptional regulator [Variovorax sp. OV329]|uniref:helix-turn-helix domain-containing protein n=1 Tax=Variovorax sp. OV329 TaxID=1882825 RepID=UPI000A40F106|nr:helix-turn-helix transcriptional regulator [Variovorax sp. OV329]